MQYELEKRQEDRSRRDFNNVASNLHHLVSTKLIPGIYNSTYLPEEKKPQAYNADVETHLVSVFKVLIYNLSKVESKKKLKASEML